MSEIGLQGSDSIGMPLFHRHMPIRPAKSDPDAECAVGNGGEGEIRTPDSLSTMPDFESGAFNRALPPLRVLMLFVSMHYRELL